MKIKSSVYTVNRLCFYGIREKIVSIKMKESDFHHKKNLKKVCIASKFCFYWIQKHELFHHKMKNNCVQ